ncbi:DUF1281 family ferredoxin-like fold protein [Glutamicibacter sp. X7]
MPNHITNQIIAPTEVIEAITRGYTPEEIQTYKDETEVIRERELTNWFTAERKELALMQRGDRAEAMLAERIADFNLVVPQPVNIETGGCSREHDEGVVCWWDWNLHYWGTKWNAYRTEIERQDDGTAKLRFETAWSHPFPVIEALSKKFPDFEFEVSYADENLGYNLGKYQIKDGARTELEELTEGSPASIDFAAQLRHGETYAELAAEWACNE